MYAQIEPPAADKCATALKVLNIVTAVIIIAFGLVGLIYMSVNSLLSAKFFLVFSPLFVILFGVMMVAGEFKINLILENFDFLNSLSGRGFFYIYLSSSIFFYFSCGTENVVLAWVSSMIIFAMGAMYVFMHFCAGEGYANSLKTHIMQEQEMPKGTSEQQQ